MGFVGTHRLLAHPDHPPRAIRSVEVELSAPGGIMLGYAVEPAGTLLLPDHGNERVDGLWHSTCFELFLRPPGAAAYREFNFAPFGAWNAYAFTGWREGMTPLDLAEPPHLVDCRLDDRRPDFPGRYVLDAVLTAEGLPPRGAAMSLTAILEETCGTRSYWALAHPPGEPDFHHQACFTATLPAIAPP